MKKVYSKPEIMFEDFTLSSSIASCDVQAESTMDQCAVEFVPGVSYIFLEGMNICDVPIVDGSGEDGVCYHNPTPGNNLFNS